MSTPFGIVAGSNQQTGNTTNSISLAPPASNFDASRVLQATTQTLLLTTPITFCMSTMYSCNEECAECGR